MRKEFRDLAPPEEAREAIADLDLGGGTERVPLDEARGRVLAERIDAPIDVPGFDRANVDGYAVRAADTFGADEAAPADLALVGTVHAGEEPGVAVGEGEAAGVSTGAVVPPGADAVVMVERTTERDGAVEVRTGVAPGENVMAAGADVAAGARALGPGTRLTPREVGLLSALGIDEVPVRARPVVGILSTGDELVRPGEAVRHAAGEIHDVNSYALDAAVAAAGGEPRLYPHVGDDREAMAATLREAAAECDLVLSSGSTSASTVDVLYRVVEERGELLLHGVAVKPGKPMLVGRIDDAAYVGLPGFPASALSIFRAFVAPAIGEAAGLDEPPGATVAGRMAVAERYAEGRLRYLPVGLVADADGETLVYPADRGSGATTTLVRADGTVAMDPDVEVIEAGTTVEVQLFSADVRPPVLLGVGEADPALWRLLDRLDRPRYLATGTTEVRRWFRDGLPDVGVLAGPDRDVDRPVAGGWTREWGLLVPAGNPDGLEGLADLVDRDLALSNRDRTSGLRASLDAALSDLAADRGATDADLADAIEGYGRGTRGIESPGRAVLDGRADAGLGLRATADALEAGFVPLGTERVDVVVNPEREAKPAVGALREELETVEELLDGLAGYEG